VTVETYPKTINDAPQVIAELVGIDAARANARLMASAPDLLAALETFIHALENNRGMMDCEAVARAAIAKATRA